MKMAKCQFKKSIAMTLLLCMILSAIPAISFAAEKDTESYIIPASDIAFEGVPEVEMYFDMPTGEISEFGLAPTAIYDAEGNIVDMERNTLTISRGMAKAESFPAAYSSIEVTNSMGVSIISPVKDQGNYGTCWAQAASSAAETVYLRNYPVESIDFSDGHTAYFGNMPRVTDPDDPTYGDGRPWPDFLNSGGNNYTSGKMVRSRA